MIMKLLAIRNKIRSVEIIANKENRAHEYSRLKQKDKFLEELISSWWDGERLS